MKKFLLLALLLTGLGLKTDLFAQSEPVLYFCERYDSGKGEIGVNDYFVKGDITVMVKCNHALDLTDVHIQFDKYNFLKGDFEFYKKFDYTVEPDMNYISFSKNSDSDLKFEEPGFYRVFLLDSGDNTIASAMIEIVD